MRRIKKASVAAALAALTATSLLPSTADAVIGQVRATGDFPLLPTANNDPSRGKAGPNFAVNPANSNHIVELHQELETEECEVVRSLDGGQTWGSAAELQAPAGFPVSLPGPCSVVGHGAGNIGKNSVAWGSGNNVYVSWTSSTQPGVVGYSILLSKSTDGGATFGTATVVAAGGAAPGADYLRPELTVEARGANPDRIIIGANNTRNQTAMVVRSEDAGATFSAPVEASNNNPVTSPAPTWTAGNTEVTAAGNAFRAARELTAPVLGPFDPTGGYRLVGANGAVFTFGNAGNFGDLAGIPLDRPIVGSATTPSGNGYWMVGTDGGIFAFGDARFFGSTGGIRLDQPIVGMASTPSGNGYWLVASDGGIFAFGDARFFGSTGGIALDRPVVGMTPTPTGNGYWLVASDGGLFAFGDAAFFGSTGGIRLDRPVIGMTATPTGRGYNLVASDGGIFSFGDAGFFGSTGGTALAAPIVGSSPSNRVGSGTRPIYLGYIASKISGACPPNCEVATENSTDGYFVIAKSTDNGNSWTRRRAINVRGFISPSGSLFGGSHFPRLAVGRNGELFATFNQGPGVLASNNCGVGPFPAGSPGAGGTNACPSYGAGSQFQSADHFMNWDMDVWFMRSLNQGTTWSDLKQLNEPKKPGLAVPEITQTRHPQIAVAPDGRIDIAWEDRRHWYLNPSDRRGATMSNTTVNPSASNLGNYRCVHSHSNCPEARLGDTYYTRSSDNGATFALNRRVNDRSHNNDVGYDYRFSTYWDYSPAIAQLGNERLLVADMDARLGNVDTESQDIFLRHVALNAGTGAIPTTSLGTGTASALSVALSQRTYPGGGEAVHGEGFTSRPWTRPVIVSETDLPSALAGGVLARANLGPLLAVPNGGNLPTAVQNEIGRLSAVGAFILGDASRVGAGVEANLASAGVPAGQIVRITGTPADIASTIAVNHLDRRRSADKTSSPPLPAFDAVIIANPNSASAASAAALAADRRLPFLFADQNSVPATTTNAIAALGVTKAIVVGSTGVISNTAAASLPNVTRLSGTDQFGTSNAVVTESLARGVARNIVYVADGNEPMHAALLGPAVGRMGGLLIMVPGGLAASADATLSAAAGLNLRPHVDRLMTSDLTGTATVPNDPA